MSVADDPESLRAKKSQNQLSSLKYHGKDRTNPASTPLSRPAFSSPGKYDVDMITVVGIAPAHSS